MYARWLILLILLLVPSLALSGVVPGIEHEEKVSFKSCEFYVHFPTETKKKISEINGVQSTMVQSVYDGKSPFLRAECIPITENINLKGTLKNFARLNGLTNPEITTENGDLGIIGTYSGVKTAGGHEIKMFGKVVVGERSVIHLLVGEPLNEFPSTKSVYFLNTIGRK